MKTVLVLYPRNVFIVCLKIYFRSGNVLFIRFYFFFVLFWPNTFICSPISDSIQGGWCFNHVFFISSYIHMMLVPLHSNSRVGSECKLAHVNLIFGEETMLLKGLCIFLLCSIETERRHQNIGKWVINSVSSISTSNAFHLRRWSERHPKHEKSLSVKARLMVVQRWVKCWYMVQAMTLVSYLQPQ